MLACTLSRKPGHGSLSYEDALTSTVFERLAYLRPDLAVRILGQASFAFRNHIFGSAPQFIPDFWPTLADVTGQQVRVEPDVVVDLGDAMGRRSLSACPISCSLRSATLAGLGLDYSKDRP